MSDSRRITVRVKVNVSLRAVLLVAAALSTGGGAVIGMVSTACASVRCVNEVVRIDQGSTYLPECRAYEQVSAPGVVPTFGEVLDGDLAIKNARAARNGDRVSFTSYYPAQNSSEANGIYLATREENGWKSENVVPSLSTSARTGCPAAMLFSAELTGGVLADGRYQAEHPYCGHNDPFLVTDEPAGWRNESELEFANLLVRESFEGAPTYRLVNRTPVSVVPNNAELQDASQNLSHVVFSEEAKLTPQAPSSGEALYVWANGTVHLVSVLPNGTGVAGRIVDGSGVVEAPNEGFLGAAPYMHAVSNNGSRVFFVAEGKLFMRENPEQEQSELGISDECTEPTKACTVQIDASQAGGSGGGATFLAAAEDGSRVFFMDEATAQLTSDTISGSKQNLYEYEVATGKLTDLTAVSDAALLGVSGFGEAEGSSYLYFVADGAFAPGAVHGQPNMYVVHDGEAPELVATLEASRDGADWNLKEELSVRTSPNGKLVAFESARDQQTANFPSGYENRDLNTGKLDEEIYLYDAESASLNCVSCQPSGARPEAGGAELLAPSSDAFIGPGAAFTQRNVLDSGAVFFQTREALVAGDENEVTDVYEYTGGELHLLSSGKSSDASLFVDASESGNDVFIATTQALVKRDIDGALSVYDVRVDGGFVEPPEAPICKGEECRGGAPTPSTFNAPVSAGFVGPGNIAPPAVEKKPSSRHQKLSRALKACRRKPKKRRHSCEAAARKEFGPKTTKDKGGGGR